MTFRDILNKLREKKELKKAAFKQLQDADQMQILLHERKKSANLRELQRYEKEDQETMIKQALEVARKKRDDDINFGHNPLDTKNIMAAEWQVLKEKNQFAGRSNMFKNQETIHNSNKQLLNNGNVLGHGSMFRNERSIFRI